MTALVSVIVPMFNEEENIAGLMRRFDAVIEDNPGYHFEFIVVDDGSSNRTVERAREHVLLRVDVRLIVLSRNFGSHYAISAGLADTRGDVAITLGADAQEPIELVARLLERWQQGYEIVWGIREARVGQGRISGFVSGIFSKLLRRYSELGSYPAEGPSVFLVDRLVVDVVNRLTEHNRNIGGLLAWSGFRQGRVTFQLQQRTAGKSKWTGSAKIKMAVDSLVEFSFTPIRFVTFSGLAVAALGFLYSAFLIARRLLFDSVVDGWTTVVVVVLILGGFQLVVLGVLGEYIWRGVAEARGRPLFIVRETVEPDSKLPEVPSDVAPKQAERG